MKTILIVDDEPKISFVIADILSKENYDILTAKSGDEAVKLIKEDAPDLVFLDIVMPRMDGIETLKKIKKINKDIPVVMLTAYENVETAVEAMKYGAADYISKSSIRDKLTIVAKNLLKTQDLVHEIDNLKEQFKDYYAPNIIGRSPKMHKVYEMIEKAASSEITVLIFGDSGTGKELIARAIHFASKRAKNPLIVVDCAVLPETLIESELFGYEKGAFTGAVGRKLGKFELATTGTLFLDEIGNLSSNVQQKLLRVLEEKRLDRLGGKHSIEIDVRLITATNVNLDQAVKNKTFREDLFYRLNVLLINLPSLKERTEDIPLLAEHFVNRFCMEQHKQKLEISKEAMEKMMNYSWPGNVRELKNVIERAVLLSDESIEEDNLPENIRGTGEICSSLPISVDMSKEINLIEIGKRAAAEAEKNLIIKVLKEVKWNKTKASKKLNIDYKTLFNKMKEYKIDY